MRIDPVLCQKILIAVEGDANAGPGQSLDISVDGYDEKVIAHHKKYLWEEGLVKGVDGGHLLSSDPEIHISDITPAGRRFLDEREPEQPRKKVGF